MSAPPRVFGEGSRAILAALVVGISADDDGGTIVVDDAAFVARVVASFDDWIGHASTQLGWGMAVVLHVLEYLPLFVVGAFSRMSKLPIAARIRYLERVEELPIGLLATALIAVKVPLSMIIYEEGEPLRLTGFDRPTISARRKLPMLAAEEDA